MLFRSPAPYTQLAVSLMASSHGHRNSIGTMPPEDGRPLKRGGGDSGVPRTPHGGTWLTVSGATNDCHQIKRKRALQPCNHVEDNLAGSSNQVLQRGSLPPRAAYLRPEGVHRSMDPHALKSPPERLESTLTESAASPFQAQPAQEYD